MNSYGKAIKSNKKSESHGNGRAYRPTNDRTEHLRNALLDFSIVAAVHYHSSKSIQEMLDKNSSERTLVVTQEPGYIYAQAAPEF